MVVEKDKFRIARSLRAICEDKGLRIFEMRKILNENGCEISKSSLANYVALKDISIRTPKIEEILKMAIALNVPSYDILGDDFRAHDVSMSGMTDCGEMQISKDLNFGDNVRTHKVNESASEHNKGDLLLVDYDVTDASIVGYQCYLVDINENQQVVWLSDQGEYYYLRSEPEPRKVTKDEIKILGKVVGRLTTNI